MKITNVILLFAFVGFSMSCSNSKEGSTSLSLEYEKTTLENGLDVVFHKDESDPIVAVSVLVHVGSNREQPGKTGFAHFFEHMLFQKSENIPEGFFLDKIGAWGGTVNGGTNTDQTIYFEVVPKDALEKVLWMESDRMGYFINSITMKDLEGEKPVVKNEKRQNYDNQPYGHTFRAINKALYPTDHPYNWTTIGELEDLQNATLEDVREFYEKWYGPNNATLVIAGDIDIEETKSLVNKYFGEIPSRGNTSSLEPRPVSLKETKLLAYEDKYAQLPELRLTFPTVENYHPDTWALGALGEILSSGKRAPLYKKIVEEEKLAPNAYAWNNGQELAGTFTILVRANAGQNLDTVYQSVEEALEDFEKNGFSDKDLERIKARQEREFYNGISSVLGKAFQLASYNTYTGDPGYAEKEIEKLMSVTKEDINRVFKKYIKGKYRIVTSFVPKGQPELMIANSGEADVVEETVVPYEPVEIIEGEGDLSYEKNRHFF